MTAGYPSHEPPKIVLNGFYSKLMPKI